MGLASFNRMRRSLKENKEVEAKEQAPVTPKEPPVEKKAGDK